MNLRGAAGVELSRYRITDATPCLIDTDFVGKIIIECAELIGTVVAHPGTARSRSHSELDAIVHRTDSQKSVVLMGHCRGRGA
jgi:hypothetical protein